MVVLLLIVAASWGKRETPSTSVCRSIAYIVEDADERMYVTSDELSLLLQKEEVYPVGKAQNIISLQGIEQAIRQHDMVRTAECYMTPRQEVKVRLTQRVPLLRVQTPGEAFLIDEDRKVMPAKAVVKDKVLVANGAVGVQIASNELADFALWLQSNRYWRRRVHHVYVQTPQMVYVYLKNDTSAYAGERVLMGPMKEYERKLAKLRTFFEKGEEAIQDKNYTELDVRFKGQVIGR